MKLALSLLALAATSNCVHAQAVTSDAPLSSAEKKELVRFVEDIASSWGDHSRDFQNGAPANDEMIQFGLHHTALRSYKLFRKVKASDSRDIRLDARHIESTALKYFGRVPRHRSQDYIQAQGIYQWTFRGSSYRGFSESFEQMGAEEVKRIRHASPVKGLWSATVSWVDGMASSDIDGPDRDVIVRQKMTLKRAPLGGKPRWILWGIKTLSPRA